MWRLLVCALVRVAGAQLAAAAGPVGPGLVVQPQAETAQLLQTPSPADAPSRDGAGLRRPQSNDPLALWARRAYASAGRLAASARRLAAPAAETPTEGGGGAGGGFTALDVLTLAPAVVTLGLLAHLLFSFVRSLREADSKEAAEYRIVNGAEVQGTSGPQTVFNICKNIVGEGMLSIPSGVAAGTGLLGSMLIALAFCMILGYTFSLMGRVCHATGGVSHKECAERCSGPRLAQLMAVTLMLKTLGSCLAYAIVIGDSFSRILHYFGLFGIYTSRQVTLLGMMGFVLVPLCLQKDLSMLSYTSTIGLFLEVVVVCFMQVRYLDGSYAPGGQFYDAIDEAHMPKFDDGVNYWGVCISTFVLLGSLMNAYLAHYNAPKYFSQSKTQTPAHFNRVVALAFVFVLSIYLWVMCVGYLTFGAASDGLILDNYANSDPGAMVARVAIGGAIVFGFPLVFTACRDSTISTLNLDRDCSSVFRTVTVGLLVPITITACFVRDLGFVNSLMGAFLGGMVTLAYPGMLAYFAGSSTPGGKDEFSRSEVYGAWAWIALGFIMSSLGTSIVVVHKFAPGLLST